MNNSPFLLHPAHTAFLNGSKRKLVGSSMGSLIMLAIVGLICAGLGLGMTAYALNEQAVYDALAKNGVTKLATVTDGRFSKGRSTTYYLTYSYEVEVNGEFQTFSREETVSANLYDKSDIGDHISVRYLPDDPGTARAIDEPFNGVILIVVGIAFIVGALYLILSHVRQYRRDRILESEGQVISGSVVKSRISGVGNKRQLHVQYEFLSPVSVTLKGKQSQRRRDVEAADVPPGTKVAVVYHNDNTFRIL